MKKLTGYHVTAQENFELIQTDGLMGSEWVDDFENSISDPFELYTDGAVFCFPDLQQAKEKQNEWDNGNGTIILEIEGYGVRFQHYYEGEQIAIRADTTIWKVIK